MAKLLIKNLIVNVGERTILNGINLEINDGEIHALMGPNGNGKSTLLSTIMGDPTYKIISGDILFNDESILNLEPDERSKKGLFLAMQNPVSIDGLGTLDFLKAIINSHRDKNINLIDLYKNINENSKYLGINPNIIERYFNTGCSGGEKKKNEILQLKLLKPGLALIDEIDSGLDVDALNLVSEAINNEILTNKLTMLIISHYDRFFDLVKPTHAHVLINGKIVVSGGEDLVKKINSEGYLWLYRELNINLNQNEKNANQNFLLNACGLNKKGNKNE